VTGQLVALWGRAVEAMSLSKLHVARG